MTSTTSSMERPSVESMLRRYTGFRQASAQTLSLLAAAARLNPLRPGQCLLIAGQEATAVHLVVEGVLRMYFPSGRDRAERTVKLFAGPELLGDAEAPMSGPSVVTVQALTDVVALRIPKDVHEQALEMDAHACHAHYRDSIRIMGELYASERRVNGATATQKLVALLQSYAAHFGRPAPGGTLIDFPLTQFDLAEQCGSNRRDVVRGLGTLYRSGALQRVGRRYLLLEREPLLAGRETPN